MASHAQAGDGSLFPATEESGLAARVHMREHFWGPFSRIWNQGSPDAAYPLKKSPLFFPESDLRGSLEALCKHRGTKTHCGQRTAEQCLP